LDSRRKKKPIIYYEKYSIDNADATQIQTSLITEVHKNLTILA